MSNWVTKKSDDQWLIGGLFDLPIYNFLLFCIIFCTLVFFNIFFPECLNKPRKSYKGKVLYYVVPRNGRKCIVYSSRKNPKPIGEINSPVKGYEGHLRWYKIKTDKGMVGWVKCVVDLDYSKSETFE